MLLTSRQTAKTTSTQNPHIARQPSSNSSGNELRELSPKGSRHGAIHHQEPTTKAFQQVTNSYYECMIPKAIQAPSWKQDHCFHFKKWARKGSSSKQQWYVSWQTQGLPYWKDKTGLDTLVPHASPKIRSACTNKVYIAKTIPTSFLCFRR